MRQTKRLVRHWNMLSTITYITREHRLEAGVGFLQLCTCWLNQKSPFYTVICSILWLWSMMFWRLVQEVKMPKKNFCNSATSAWGSMHSFVLSALSVGILRFEELAQSLDVLMLVCKSKLPWSHVRMHQVDHSEEWNSWPSGILPAWKSHHSDCFR